MKITRIKVLSDRENFFSGSSQLFSVFFTVSPLDNNEHEPQVKITVTILQDNILAKP